MWLYLFKRSLNPKNNILSLKIIKDKGLIMKDKIKRKLKDFFVKR